jgi:antitoxin (DNA-binding transcriptional repressor) of toxin-antitoxin stability system
MVQEMSSEEARRDWRRLLSDTERGVHTEITRYGEGVAAVVPCEWMDEVTFLLAAMAQAAAEWDLRVPDLDDLRKVFATAGGLLALAIDEEHAATLEENTRLHVEELKQRNGEG